METLIIVSYTTDQQLNTIYENTDSVLYTASDFANKTHKIITLVNETQLDAFQQNNLPTTIVKSDPDISKFTVFYHPDLNAREELASYGKITTLFDNYTLVEQLPKAEMQPPATTRYIYFETPLADSERTLPNPLTIQEERLQLNQQTNNVGFLTESNIVPTTQPTPTSMVTLTPTIQPPMIKFSELERFLIPLAVLLAICMVITIFLVRRITKKK